MRCGAGREPARCPEPALPARITHVAPDWRTPAPLELYVDFETVSNLADDFTSLPGVGGQPLIFQVGCGWHEDGEWRFWQRTADRLDPPSEAGIVDSWVGRVDGLLTVRGLGPADLRVVHWSHAEASSLDTAYNDARTRRPAKAWPDIPGSTPWSSSCARNRFTRPRCVRLGLKPIAKAMRAAGLIATTWEDGPADGLGAMVGAWWCDAEAARTGTVMGALPLMADIGRYNEVDCRAMAEVISWLRDNR